MGTKSLDQHIEISSDVLGAKPRIAGRRISVAQIIVWHEWMGRSADEIATEYNLTLSEIYAALAYYYTHQAEIDESMRASRSVADTLREQVPSKVPPRISAHPVRPSYKCR